MARETIPVMNGRRKERRRHTPYVPATLAGRRIERRAVRFRSRNEISDAPFNLLIGRRGCDTWFYENRGPFRACTNSQPHKVKTDAPRKIYDPREVRVAGATILITVTYINCSLSRVIIISIRYVMTGDGLF